MVHLAYNQIIETSLNEIYIFDATTLKFIEVNRGARDNLGYTLEELQQLTPLDIKPEHTRDSFEELITPLRNQTHSKIVFETYHLRKDGTTYPVEIHLQLTNSSETEVFVAIILDITERLKLRTRNFELGRIFEDSLNEIYIFDATTLKFVQVNRGARDNLGYTMHELSQMTPLDLKPTYTMEKFGTLIAPLLDKTECIVLFETYHLRKDGTTYPVEVHLQLSTLEGKKVFVAIILDITERREADKKLLDLTLQNQRAQLIQNFIRDTSHEFRTPLSVLSVKTHLLEKSLAKQQNLRHIEGMRKQIKRIESLVDSLQEASVLETTEHIHPQPVNIQYLIDNLIDENKALCLDKGITIHRHMTDVPMIYGDVQLLTTAIFNVLKNACDFNVQHGRIDLSTTSDETYLTITIADTGSGISPQDLPHIFDYLYRGDEARSMQGGYGLGLSIAQRIIQLHHGRIDVQSDETEGSTFTIKLPITVPEQHHTRDHILT